jgi:hypothetical protein
LDEAHVAGGDETGISASTGLFALVWFVAVGRLIVVRETEAE